jgi:hypothetical protein
MVSKPCSENRFEAVNVVLDRDVVQRGWTHSVDPDYHQTLQEGTDAFKDLEFGVCPLWSLCHLIGMLGEYQEAMNELEVALQDDQSLLGANIYRNFGDNMKSSLARIEEPVRLG